MNEKISRFLDGDLSHDETLYLLHSMETQPELKDKLKRYAVVSHAMKTDNFLWISADFPTKIHSENTQAMSAYDLPLSKQRRYLLALAASVVVTVLIEQGTARISTNHSNQIASLPLVQQTFKPVSQLGDSKESYSFNAHIVDYFHEYNDSGYFTRRDFGRIAPDQHPHNHPLTRARFLAGKLP
jgi:sigma-E factor negative regulatory protein RseA